MKLPRIAVVAAAIFTLTFSRPFAIAQTPNGTTASATQFTSPAASELSPILVTSGTHAGDVVVTLEVGKKGSVKNATLVSGNPKLFGEARSAVKMFHYAQLAGTNSATQLVHFTTHDAFVSVGAVIYPPIARAAHISGIVQIVFEVDADGHVGTIYDVEGPAMLRGAATDGLKQTVYKPRLVAGKPASFSGISEIDFAL